MKDKVHLYPVREKGRLHQYSTLGLLSLISNWVNPGNSKFNKYTRGEIVYSSQVHSQFEELIKCLNIRNQSSTINKFYIISESFNDNLLVELKRINYPSEYKRLPRNIILPIDLFHLLMEE
ncbi:MAG: hypothetical protein CMP59_00655 [Flavobacteriales bacterium]|nr:hypothetical protein [Flavobacteriales bacterium]